MNEQMSLFRSLDYTKVNTQINGDVYTGLIYVQYVPVIQAKVPVS